MNTLVYNAIRTPDGTLMVSRNRHDYQTHVDSVTGEVYMVDGGLEYVRRNVNEVPAEELSVYMEDGHDTVREVLSWGTRGPDGRQPLHFVVLADMSSAHIQACLDTQMGMHPTYRTAMLNELEYRRK